MDTQRDWERLAQHARQARGSRSQKAVDKAGGPSHTTLGKIERAEWRPVRGVDDTISKLETVYRWAPGSVDIILGGGDPTSTEAPQPRPDEAPSPGLAANSGNASKPDYTIHDERLVLESCWSSATDLADAVLRLEDPPEDLLAAARFATYTISSYLIIRILKSEFAVQLEDWLGRLYSERERLWRALTVGEPVFPWYADSSVGGDGGVSDQMQESPGQGASRWKLSAGEVPGVLRGEHGQDRHERRG